MQINSKFSRPEFLASYWQKKPLVIKDAFCIPESFPKGEDLAGLACEEFVESRLILANNKQNEWLCEYGYFDETRFTRLDKQNWTLLVQNVDDFIPETKTLSKAFDFLPSWRLDDVMLSYATPGGGVGPHFDYYDVFLLQTSGSREWKIGQHCNSQSPLRDHPDMKLLEHFVETESHVLNIGDMLYIPAGIAHWGTAMSSDCITASIGFRAPAYSELLSASINKLADNFSQDQRYKDSDISKDKYLIPESIKDQFSELVNSLDTQELVDVLVHQFSLQVTEMRHPDLLETEDSTLESVDWHSLKHDPNSRFAYRMQNDNATLYVNGVAFETDLITARAICHSEFRHVNDKYILQQLLGSGALVKN